MIKGFDFNCNPFSSMGSLNKTVASGPYINAPTSVTRTGTSNPPAFNMNSDWVAPGAVQVGDIPQIQFDSTGTIYNGAAVATLSLDPPDFSGSGLPTLSAGTHNARVRYTRGALLGAWGLSADFTIVSAVTALVWKLPTFDGTATLSDGDQTITGTSASMSAESNVFLPSGKLVISVTHTVKNVWTGMALSSTAAPSVLYTDANSLQLMNNQIWHSGSSYTSLTYNSGDVISFAIDVGAKKLWITRDGTTWEDNSGSSRSLADVGAGTGGLDVSYLSAGTLRLMAGGIFGEANGAVHTINQTPPITLPSGYSYAVGT